MDGIWEARLVNQYNELQDICTKKIILHLARETEESQREMKNSIEAFLNYHKGNERESVKVELNTIFQELQSGNVAT